MADAPKKRGRPPLTEAEKKRRAAEKAATRPRKKPGSKRKTAAKPKPCSKRKTAAKPKPASAVMLADGAGDARIEEEIPQEERRGPGNPGKWKDENIELARIMAKAGFTDLQMAEELGICIATFYVWTSKKPEFLDAIKMAKDAPDDRTERSLYHRANGYEWIEEVPTKVKEIEYDNGRKVKETEKVIITKVKRFTPPDPTSSIFWLKNRRPEIWRDKKEVEVNPHEDWLAKVTAMEDSD